MNDQIHFDSTDTALLRRLMKEHGDSQFPFFGTNEDGLKVLNSQIYQNGIVQSRFETACVYSLALCLLIFLVTRIQFILEKRMVHYQ